MTDLQLFEGFDHKDEDTGRLARIIYRKSLEGATEASEKYPGFYLMKLDEEYNMYKLYFYLTD